jgi:hypothetical protein
MRHQSRAVCLASLSLSLSLSLAQAQVNVQAGGTPAGRPPCYQVRSGIDLLPVLVLGNSGVGSRRRKPSVEIDFYPIFIFTVFKKVPFHVKQPITDLLGIPHRIANQFPGPLLVLVYFLLKLVDLGANRFKCLLLCLCVRRLVLVRRGDRKRDASQRQNKQTYRAARRMWNQRMCRAADKLLNKVWSNKA